MDQVASQNVEAMRVLIVLAAIAIAVFWRTALKWALMIIAILAMVSIGYGALALWQSMQHPIA